MWEHALSCGGQRREARLHSDGKRDKVLVQDDRDLCDNLLVFGL
jgi:hypothetical protein